MVYSSERYYSYLTSERTTTTVEILIWCKCYSSKIIITAWFNRLGNLILDNFCEVYSIIILRLCSFCYVRPVFLLTKCTVMGEKWLWNVLLDCFQLPGKSVFSEHNHARNVALKWDCLHAFQCAPTLPSQQMPPHPYPPSDLTQRLQRNKPINTYQPNSDFYLTNSKLKFSIPCL